MNTIRATSPPRFSGPILPHPITSPSEYRRTPHFFYLPPPRTETMEGPVATMAGGNEEPVAIFLKIALDQTAFTTAINLAYATLDGLLADQTPSEAFARARQVPVPSIVASWRFWPFVHLLSYSPLIPIEFKLLWIGTMEIAWIAILSTTVNAKPSDVAQAEVTPAYVMEEQEGGGTAVPWGEGRLKQIKTRSEAFAKWAAGNLPSFQRGR